MDGYKTFCPSLLAKLFNASFKRFKHCPCNKAMQTGRLSHWFSSRQPCRMLQYVYCSTIYVYIARESTRSSTPKAPNTYLLVLWCIHISNRGRQTLSFCLCTSSIPDLIWPQARSLFQMLNSNGKLSMCGRLHAGCIMFSKPLLCQPFSMLNFRNSERQLLALSWCLQILLHFSLD